MPQSAAPAAIASTAADICARNSSAVIRCAGEVWVNASVEPAQKTPASACSEIKAMTSECTVRDPVQSGAEGRQDGSGSAIIPGSVADGPRGLGARIAGAQALAGGRIDLDALGIALVAEGDVVAVRGKQPQRIG